MKILLVDDQLPKYFAIDGFLKTHFPEFTLEWVKSFSTARVNIRSGKFDLILLDMSFEVHATVIEEANFAGLAGLHILQFMRRARINTPVIVCTAHVRYSDPDFQTLEGVEELEKYINDVFGPICKGCVYLGAEEKIWAKKLKRLITNAAQIK